VAGSKPTLTVVAGPNGSGKSSLIRSLVAIGYDFGEYINADDIELGLGDLADPQARSREAQRLADAQREACLEGKVDFSFETVMSHPSKTDFMNRARTLGYRVVLLFVSLDDPLMNVARVELRVAQGGHSVPPDRVVARYARTLALLPRAILASDRAVLFDNSEPDAGPRLIVEFLRDDGHFQGKQIDRLADWFAVSFKDLWTRHVPRTISFVELESLDRQLTASITFP
jgi:predicted ABC-type ATPase